MKNAVLVVATVLIGLAAQAQSVSPAGPATVDGVGKVVYGKDGKPTPFVRGKGKGKMVVFDLQDKIPAATVEKSLDYFRHMTRITIERTGGSRAWSLAKANEIMRSSTCKAAIFIVDDSRLPLTLSAVEARWGMVNVSRMDEGSPSASTTENRFKKLFARAFGYSFGAGDAMPMMGALVPMKEGTMREVDTIPDPSFTPQGVAAIQNHLMLIGIYGERLVSYRRACIEGWAPPPTNDIQRAIWEKVHQIPDKPMTIEYDPKKDK